MDPLPLYAPDHAQLHYIDPLLSHQTNNAPTSWIGHYQPCIDRPRRSLSYLMGFATEETFTDFWIGTSDEPLYCFSEEVITF